MAARTKGAADIYTVQIEGAADIYTIQIEGAADIYTVQIEGAADIYTVQIEGAADMREYHRYTSKCKKKYIQTANENISIIKACEKHQQRGTKQKKFLKASLQRREAVQHEQCRELIGLLETTDTVSIILYKNTERAGNKARQELEEEEIGEREAASLKKARQGSSTLTS